MQTKNWIAAGVVAVLFAALPVSAGVIIHFDQDEYRVTEGESFQVNVFLDADDQTDGDQVLDAGLLTMKFEVRFDPTHAGVLDTNQILLPKALNDDGFGRGPNNEVGSGFIKIRGNIPSNLPLEDAFRGEDRGDGVDRMRLATITINGLSPGEFLLQLHPLEESANDDVFVDGNVNVLDDDISFATAQVTVDPIPEPSTACVFVIGGLLWCQAFHRRGRKAIQ